MDQSPLKTEVDVARVLLEDGWRPVDINGVLQFPLSEETYRQLGAASLFFLISDDFLAEDVRPGAKQDAMATLLQLGWLEAEAAALLKPDRFFKPERYQGFQDYPGQQRLPSPLQDQLPYQPLNLSQRRLQIKKLAPSSRSKVASSLNLERLRRSKGINRLLGLLLILIALVLFIFTL